MDTLRLEVVEPKPLEPLSSAIPNARTENVDTSYCNALSGGHFVYVLANLLRDMGSSEKFLAILDTRKNKWRWVRLAKAPSSGQGLFLVNDTLFWFNSPSSDEQMNWDLQHFDLLLEQLGRITPGGSKPQTRYGFSGNFLERYNCYIVFGGRSLGIIPGRCFNDIYMLDLNRYSWNQPKVKGKLPPPRFRHGSCVHEGSLYVFGGKGNRGRLNDGIYILRFTTGTCVTWSNPTLNSCTVPERSSLCLVPYKGVILICGGLPPQSDVSLYDPNSCTYKEVSLSEATRRATPGLGYAYAAVVTHGGGAIALLGGQSHLQNYLRLSVV